MAEARSEAAHSFAPGRPTVVGTGKSDAELAAEIRALLASVADRIDEAARRAITVNFRVDRAGPGGPFVVTECRIDKVHAL